jgi:aminomethyltransferase
VMWIGLAARDSLRLEAGLCLHGNDITPETDPATAGLMWAIPQPVREAGKFVGAQALSGILEKGPAEKRVGLKPDGRQPVRTGSELFDEAGVPVGRVTSGGFGPTVNAPVAMGYVRRELSAPGTALFAEVRGNRVPISVHSLPFTPHRYRKG